MEYGLIGAKLGHCYSKIIHEMPCAAIPTTCMPAAHGGRSPGLYAGKGVQSHQCHHPYKKLVIPYCDLRWNHVRRPSAQ